ncbi:hypothetical protein K6T79_18325 [Mycolicibacter sp. MYC098]|uniref:Uncharacterized protein n=1 Tax=[Mycobacterium] crassicus TaxID=2872309 RepID=A0ABU5XL60_9MYCO|nr:hypothetical protein [Mycolicibacter sp. MYC098]
MTEGGRERQAPDSRERAQMLRAVAQELRTVDPAGLTGEELQELYDSLPREASRLQGQPRPSNVRQLPIRPGPSAAVRRYRLTFESIAAEVERAADGIDRRLDEAEMLAADTGGAE